MKKILMIVPALIIAGLAVLSPISFNEEPKQEALTVKAQFDPGTGW